MMLKVKLKDLDVLAGRRIIKAFEIESLNAAENVLIDAQEWSKNYEINIKAEMEEQQRQALAKGYAEGLAQFSKAVERYNQATALVNENVMSLLRDCLVRILQNLPTETVLHDLVAPILGDIRTKQDVMVQVHPDVLEDMRKALKKIEISTPDYLKINAFADPSIGIDDFLIYTEDDVFNVSIPITCNLLCQAIENHSMETDSES